MTNVVNFPLSEQSIIRLVTAQDDQPDPHTTAIQKIKEAIQFGTQHCGNAWTFNVLKAQLEIADAQNGWRDRARKLFEPKETV